MSPGKGVCRLFGQADRHRRSDDRRNLRGGDFRRRARRLESHLRRGDLDAEVAGLDRRPRAHVPLFRRRAEAAGSRQSEERGQQGLLLRSRDQPDLRGHGGALLGWRPAGAAGKATGQGEGRGRGQIRPDLHSGTAAPADLLLARRMQPGDRAGHATHEHRPMRNLGLSRRELFEKIERGALTTLPADDWEFAEWRRARVNLDYHIEVHDFLYSVPHALIRAEVEVRIDARTVEIFHRGKRVAAHQRRYMGRKHGTDPDHMPSSHRHYAEWTPDRFRRWAGKIGPNTEGLINAVLASRPHPEQGFRTCLGILRSYRGIDAARVEAISNRALELGVLNCKGVAALLARKPDDAAAKNEPPATLFDHANLRGPGYYH